VVIYIPLTRPEELKKFIKLLMKEAPEGYKPHLFRCQRKSKAPELKFGSWKDKKNKLTPKEALKWMKKGNNIGIAGMNDDPLVNVDIDDDEKTEKNDLKPTLIARSRSRTGMHAFYFTKDNIPNIATNEAGEIRTNGQYVIAPGSFVPCDKNVKNAGYYTVEEENSVSWITFKELPEVFIKKHKKNQERNKVNVQRRNFDPKQSDGKTSALYEIDTRDIVMMEGGSTTPKDRWTAIFHGSDTKMNMSFSDGLLHCWRHSVSHNALQALTTLSGYMSCEEAGSPHKESSAGPSGIINDDGAIFHSWIYAKKNGYIPKDDPCPVRALHYIARKHDICEPEEGKKLPPWAYNRIIKILEEEY